MAKSGQSIGDLELLKQPAVAFFCSTRCDGDAVLAAYAWARQQCDLGNTVVSGFHTPVEKDVYAILARRGARIIHCLPRRLPKRLSSEQKTLIDEGRLQLVTPPDCANFPRATKQSCSLRNRYVAQASKEIMVAYIHPESILHSDLAGFYFIQL